MKEFLKLKIYFIFYRILILIILLLCAKFIYDFSLMNQEAVNIVNSNIKYNEFIRNPRIQMEENGFTYIKADLGYLRDNDYVFENVNMSGDFGNITSGKLEITDNKSEFTFTINPNVIIYIE